jgi:hypothetical protein
MNPNGLDAFRYPFLLLYHQHMMDHVMEWWSPDFHLVWTRPLEWLLLLLTVSLAGSGPARPRDLLLLAGLVHGALYSNRHMPVLAIAGAPIVAGRLETGVHSVQVWMDARRWVFARWQAVAATVLGIGLAGGVVVRMQELPRGSWFAYCATLETFPVRACRFLRSRPVGRRLFNDYNWGGFCLWSLWPRYQVFIDGRDELYFHGVHADYDAIQRLEPGWEERLRRRQVDTVLMPPFASLAQALARSAEWRLVYRDEQAMIFRRTAAGPPAAVRPASRRSEKIR